MDNTREPYSSDELQAMWQSFQGSQGATCPTCGAEVRIELSEDPAEGESEVAEIRAVCPNCGREGRDQPGEHPDTYGWVD